MAWHLQLNAQEYVWITNHDHLDGDPNAREWIVGRYHEEGGWIKIRECSTLNDAMEAGPRLRFNDGALVERAFPSLESALIPTDELWRGAMNTEGDEISIVKAHSPNGIECKVRGHDRSGGRDYDITTRPTWEAARAFLCRYTGNLSCPDPAEPEEPVSPAPLHHSSE
ncbi:MAG TPA: hypothetical protein VFS20_27640 [Longimicrobium sp.]|nr:hypothetical protein [Longimicrobium sp.]